MLSFSEQATSDLDAILDYSFIKFGAQVMMEYHHSLDQCFENLDSHPELGTQVDYIRTGYRRFEHRSHCLFYQSTHQGITLIRILHKSMNVHKHFK